MAGLCWVGVVRIGKISYDLLKERIKTIMRYNFTSTRMIIIKKWKVASVGEDVEKLEPSCLVSGNVK